MMESFTKYVGINQTISLICCMFWIISKAEGNTISEVAGTRVTMHCNNESISGVRSLTWKMNEQILLTFSKHRPLHVSEEALRLNINMSQSESHLYALVIEKAQKSHTGNYTCHTNTERGTWEQKWELIITDYEEAGNNFKLMTAVAIAVPCVCCLIFIIVLTVLKTVHKKSSRNNIHSPAAATEKPEDIYENCLETGVSQQWSHNQHCHHQRRTH